MSTSDLGVVIGMDKEKLNVSTRAKVFLPEPADTIDDEFPQVGSKTLSACSATPERKSTTTHETSSARARDKAQSSISRSPTPIWNLASPARAVTRQKDARQDILSVDDRDRLPRHVPNSSPPVTPARPQEQNGDDLDFLPPPALWGFRPEKPPLLDAIKRDSVALVGEILRNDPGLASMPFLDHGFDYPLHCAVKSCCSAEIVRLLLQHGAAVNNLDAWGRTAAHVLAERVAAMEANPFRGLYFPDRVRRDAENIANVMEVLKAAGADL